MMIDSYLSVILWTLFFFAETCPSTSYLMRFTIIIYLLIFFVYPSCTRTHGPHLHDVIVLFMTMAQSRQVLCSTMGPLVARFCVNFHDVLYSYYLKPLLYTIDKCIVGRYIFIIFNCLRILTRAFVYISYFDAARWRADTEITQKSSSAASILLSSMVKWQSS